MAEDTRGEGSEHKKKPTADLSSLAKTPVNVPVLATYLSEYNSPDAAFLLDGFLHGFSLQYQGPRLQRDAPNLKSARINPEIVQQKIDKEVREGRVAGPFQNRPFPNLIVSPLGLVPKKEKNEFRMIHHLSYPAGKSVNDFIDPELCSVQYTSFDEAVFLIQDLGKHCKLFKMDLKNAFRLIPINPTDFELLGFYHDGKFYFDKALPFGSSISCRIFETFSTFLEFCVRQRMPSGKLIHYLDDFLGGEKASDICSLIMKVFETCMSDLGVPLATDKTTGPTTVIVFLGLELDSDLMVVRIPSHKVAEVIQKIQNILSKDKCELRVMQSLIGSLNFCCRAIPAGRPFCRRLINSICGLTKPHHHLRISKSIKLDLDMWLQFFQNHNGISVFHDRFWVSNSDLELFTDSAGGQDCGFGIYFQGRWCAAKWPTKWHSIGYTSDITLLELFPILVAVCIWGKELTNKRLALHCDNQAVVHIINTMSSKSAHVMCLVRLLTMKCLHNNTLLRASHVPGKHNLICDALSRFQMARFRELAPAADLEPHLVPPRLWDIFTTELNALLKEL